MKDGSRIRNETAPPMRRPHVYERSAPRGQRPAYHEPASDFEAAAREIASALPALIARAEAAGLATLAGLLGLARDEAERGG